MRRLLRRQYDWHPGNAFQPPPAAPTTHADQANQPPTAAPTAAASAAPRSLKPGGGTGGGGSGKAGAAAAAAAGPPRLEYVATIDVKDRRGQAGASRCKPSFRALLMTQAASRHPDAARSPVSQRAAASTEVARCAPLAAPRRATSLSSAGSGRKVTSVTPVPSSRAGGTFLVTSNDSRVRLYHRYALVRS